jgi:hypothetical protein
MYAAATDPNIERVLQYYSLGSVQECIKVCRIKVRWRPSESFQSHSALFFQSVPRGYKL